MCIDARALVETQDHAARESIAATLERFGPGALELTHRERIRIVMLRTRERYDAASPVLRRMGVDVDAWPSPPAGLFVVEERTVFLRSRSPMAVAHEFAHALDCALGGGLYLSGYDSAIRSAFAQASHFVTPYAASSVDEYFAESVRAYIGVSDPHSPWPKATRARLAAVDGRMHAVVETLFRERLAHASEARPA